MLQFLFKILASITVSNSTAERTFSKLKILKTYLRNSTSDENIRLEGIISFNREVEIDLDMLINNYSQKNNMRMKIIL